MLSQQLDSNYLSSAYMAHAALNAWLPKDDSAEGNNEDNNNNNNNNPQAPARHLIFTASFAALFGVAGYAPYAPAKAALRSLSDALSQELALYEGRYAPVRVHTLLPATIHTASYTAENRIKSDLTKMLEEDDKGQSADEVARASVRGLEQGWELVSTTWLTRVVLAGVWGPSRRCGWGVLDGLLGMVMVWVLVGVRWDIDRKTRAWGRRYGVDGMKR